jgi:uncharacterized BrkB/YihY/UPF0761 family membrane protein
VYYSSLIFFLGAEFTQVYATQYGSGVVPAENAQSIAAANETTRRESPPPEKRSAGSPRPNLREGSHEQISKVAR